jgi:exopolysaccharide production protein ExoQ
MSKAPSDAMDASGMQPVAGIQPARPRSLSNYMRYSDPLMMFLWVVSTTLLFTWLAPFRYLAAFYFAGALFLLARQTIPVVARCWPLFLLPILCTISALWSPSTDEALRKGLGLALTGGVAIYAATRLSGRQILLAYFATELIAAVLSAVSPVVIEGNWAGIFGQKNFYALHMFFLFVSSLALALDRGTNRWLRALAAIVVPFSVFMVLMAKSGTITVLLLGASVVMIGQVFLWQPTSRIRHARTLLALTLAIAVLITAYVLFGMMQIDVMEEVLGALGKDSTLTGRTMLWQLAEQSMAEHPLTGLGANGFWRQESGVANSVLQSMGFERLIIFNFHNAYYENGVNYGYPGMIATMFLAAWALVSSALNWIRNQSIINAAFLVLAGMIILRTTSEADLAAEYSGTSVLLFIAAARKEWGPKRVGQPAAFAAPAPAVRAGA